MEKISKYDEEEEFSFLEDQTKTSGFIAIITATDLETEELHKIITPLPGKSHICKIFGDELTYYCGVIGRYCIIHTQCGMGTSGRTASTLTSQKLINEINPKILIMVGIAFGVDKNKQNIGDVIISESIQPYENQRVSDNRTTCRAISTPASNFILSRIKSLKTSWNFPLEEKNAELLFGTVLSGEKLIDNETYRDGILGLFPQAIGGEMEGAGIAASCDGKVEWVLIKGICDFADGNKNINKHDNQIVAAQASLSVLSELFANKTVFKSKGISCSEQLEKQDNYSFNLSNVKDVIFDVYNKEKEKYYIERDDDINFQNLSENTSVWVHGKSGVGKSTVILRNTLKYDKKDLIFISLSACIDEGSNAFFIQIISKLSSVSS
jgi:nucleoside phosphorylase